MARSSTEMRFRASIGPLRVGHVAEEQAVVAQEGDLVDAVRHRQVLDGHAERVHDDHLPVVVTAGTGPRDQLAQRPVHGPGAGLPGADDLARPGQLAQEALGVGDDEAPVVDVQPVGPQVGLLLDVVEGHVDHQRARLRPVMANVRLGGRGGGDHDGGLPHHLLRIAHVLGVGVAFVPDLLDEDAGPIGRLIADEHALDVKMLDHQTYVGPRDGAGADHAQDLWHRRLQMQGGQGGHGRRPQGADAGGLQNRFGTSGHRVEQQGQPGRPGEPARRVLGAGIDDLRAQYRHRTGDETGHVEGAGHPSPDGTPTKDRLVRDLGLTGRVMGQRLGDAGHGIHLPEGLLDVVLAQVEEPVGDPVRARLGALAARPHVAIMHSSKGNAALSFEGSKPYSASQTSL